jgi:hypothetical protein
LSVCHYYEGKTRNKRKTKFKISDWARLETTYAPTGELRDIRKHRMIDLDNTE